MTLSPEQCRMARAALGLGVRELAHLADVSPNTVARLERGERMQARTLAFMRGSLEAAGVIFIEGGAVSALGGPGVRLGREAPASGYGMLFEALWNVPSLRRQPEAAYDALLGIAELYLDIVEAEGRQPDVWERLDLNDLLHALKRSDVFSAKVYLEHAITPPDNQSPDYSISEERSAGAAPLDLAYFRRCLAALKARGYTRQSEDASAAAPRTASGARVDGAPK